jgi:hypothetical protein
MSKARQDNRVGRVLQNALKNVKKNTPQKQKDLDAVGIEPTTFHKLYSAVCETKIIPLDLVAVSNCSNCVFGGSPTKRPCEIDNDLAKIPYFI